MLRQNDSRIRYRVVDEIYIRRVDFVANSAKVDFGFNEKLPPQGNMQLEDITYQGAPVYNWLLHRLELFVASNQIVKGIHSLNYRFKTPLKLTLPFGEVSTNGVQIQFELRGCWIAQRVEIDATSGLYNWMRRTVHLGPGQTTVSYKDVRFGEGGAPIKSPPDFDPTKPPVLVDGEVTLNILDLGGITAPQLIPKLDDFVMGEDLELVRRDLPRETYFS